MSRVVARLMVELLSSKESKSSSQDNKCQSLTTTLDIEYPILSSRAFLPICGGSGGGDHYNELRGPTGRQE